MAPPHFVLLPFLAQGHIIPMVDTARVLAQHGATVTLVTTPLNASRFHSLITRSRLPIRVAQVPFPSQQSGLPDGYENFDLLPSMDFIPNFFSAINNLQLAVENLLSEISPPPNCIISELCFEWINDTARKFNVPRYVAHLQPCFAAVCKQVLSSSKFHKSIQSNTEYFTVPDLPDEIQITKAQLPELMREEIAAFADKTLATESESYGIILNTCHELESEYIKMYKEARKGLKIWCIGPVSLCNRDDVDKSERGNVDTAIDRFDCLNWLDSQESSSVVYVCLGSLCNLSISQLIELGLGLEASEKPFIWVIRSKEFDKWLEEENFEERVKGRGLLIRGWAPQVLILPHPAIGGFLTHCGWNSTLEGISAGVQLLTWPLFAEQFCNEKLIVNVLKIGVRMGVEVPTIFMEEEEERLVKKEDVEMALRRFMDEGEGRDERMRRARDFKKMTKRAVEEGGSSYIDVELLIRDIEENTTGCDNQ